MPNVSSMSPGSSPQPELNRGKGHCCFLLLNEWIRIKYMMKTRVLKSVLGWISSSATYFMRSRAAKLWEPQFLDGDPEMILCHRGD